MSREEIAVVVKKLASGFSPTDKGKLTGAVMRELHGPAYRQAGEPDGNLVKQVVEENLRS